MTDAEGEEKDGDVSRWEESDDNGMYFAKFLKCQRTVIKLLEYFAINTLIFKLGVIILSVSCLFSKKMCYILGQVL